MKRIAFIASLLSLFVLGTAAADVKVENVTAEQAEKLIKDNQVTVLDVRTPDEFKEGHIKGAQNIDFSGADFASKLKQIDKSKPVLVHCQAGGRSAKSLPALEKLGVKIYHFDGGFSAWEDAGKPVAR